MDKKLGQELYDRGISKTYAVTKESYNTKIKRLSDKRRKFAISVLSGSGMFVSKDKQTYGNIVLNDRGDVVVEYYSIRGKVYEEKQTVYLIDTGDILDDCEVVQEEKFLNRKEVIEFAYKLLESTGGEGIKTTMNFKESKVEFDKDSLDNWINKIYKNLFY